MQHAPDIPRSGARPASAPAREPDEQPTLLEVIGEVADMTAGGVAALLPFIVLSMPAFVLFVLFPLMLAAIPALLAGLLLGPPYLVVRMARRWRRGATA